MTILERQIRRLCTSVHSILLELRARLPRHEGQQASICDVIGIDMSTKVAVEVPIKRSQSEKDDSGVIVEEYNYERALDVGVGLITVAKKSNSSSCPIGPKVWLEGDPIWVCRPRKKSSDVARICRRASSVGLITIKCIQVVKRVRFANYLNIMLEASTLSA